MNCRFCACEETFDFVDLGHSPVSNAYLPADFQSHNEIFYPLKVVVCSKCFLVQLEHTISREQHFSSDYAYFSSTSSYFLKHAKELSEFVVDKLNLNEASHVCEVASNDGYLLTNFQLKNIPCVGIEPTQSTAQVAIAKGLNVIQEFFGMDIFETHPDLESSFDALFGLNVLAHVPDINDFTKAIERALKPEGVVILEFPHLLDLINEAQFDTIYHEHYSYLSLTTVAKIFSANGLKIVDVQSIGTHGGSLRVFGAKQKAEMLPNESVVKMLRVEQESGITSRNIYENFSGRIKSLRDEVRAKVIQYKRGGKKIAAFGAAAKGNTFLNYCGLNSNDIDFVADSAESKQGKFTPGSHIPIVHPSEIRNRKPDIIIILPWNIECELRDQLKRLINCDVILMTCIPQVNVSTLRSDRLNV